MSQPESAIRDDSETAPASAIADSVPRSRWWVLVVVCVGTMMTFVNVSSTIGGLAIIQSDLHAGSAAAVWISSAYSLVVASLVLGAGTLADLVGRRLVFAAGATLFAVGSATAFASHSTPALIAAQVVMGVGGAMVLPAGLAIVSHAFADHERTEAISIWAGSSGLGLAVGPLVAGALLGTFSWHSIYMINVVLGAIALLGAVTLVAESRQPGRTLDPVGIALGTLAVGALTYAVIEGGASGYTAGHILVAYAVLAVSLVGFVWYEARHPDPMLDVTLFRSASFSAVLAGAAITMFAFTGTALVTVLYLQHVQETTPLGAGSRLLVMFVPFIVVSALAGRLVHRTGFKTMLTLGLLVMAAGVFALLAAPPEPGFGRVWPGLLLVGIGSGMLVAPSTAAAVISVPLHQAGMASAAVNMFRQVGNVLGASILGTILTTRFATELADDLHRQNLPDETVGKIVEAAGEGDSSTASLPAALADRITAAVHEAFTSADHLALTAAGAVLLVTALPVLAFVRQRPAHVAAD
ncbi:MFS transporter [Nocardia fusca]|uniref:MFS transporter n=1 Tax=Nocardia fusca TaxID=941183 RepID=UPI0007A75C81|nr:MFS transporter [Nocardia fusca]